MLPAYYPLKLAAYFLREFGSTLAQAEPASVTPTADDPYLWVTERVTARRRDFYLCARIQGASIGS